MMAIKPGTIRRHPPPLSFFSLSFFFFSLQFSIQWRYDDRSFVRVTRIGFTRLHRRYPLTFPRSNTEIVDLRRLQSRRSSALHLHRSSFS